jgi:DNA invertase Pin-like site-specific DNA recombinase
MGGGVPTGWMGGGTHRMCRGVCQDAVTLRCYGMSMSRKRTVPAQVAKATPARPAASRNDVPKREAGKSGKISAPRKPQDARKPAAMTSRSSTRRIRSAAAAGGALVGYARVSTDDQNTRAQVDALRATGCADIFEDDAVSGTVVQRDGLTACLESLHVGDTLVVTALDRLGRSMPHLVSTVHDLAERGIGFRSLAEAIDTTSAAGKLVLHMFAALAAFERDLISERTKAALAAKKRRGESVGRRPGLTPAQVREARALLAAGRGPSYVARTFRVGRSTLYRHLGATS